MRKIIAIAGSAALAGVLAGCASHQDTGAVIGGILGGIAGSNVGHGDGRTAATIVGTVAGAAIGSAIGRSMDETDRLRAQHALEHNRTWEPSSWHNPDSDVDYTLTPTRTWQTPQGNYCREFQTDAMIGGKRERVYGTACRQADGSWEVTG